jgi:hypothetical protein
VGRPPRAAIARAAVNGGPLSSVRSVCLVAARFDTWEAFPPRGLALAGYGRASPFLFAEVSMIGSSKIGPRVRELTDGREQIEFHWLVGQIFGGPVRDLLPIQKAISEASLWDCNFRPRSRSTLWERN